MLILRSAGSRLPARPRTSTHGPHRSSRLECRVSRTFAPRRLEPLAQQPRDLPGERRLRVAGVRRRAGRVAGLLETAGRHQPVDLARVVVVAELVTGVDHDRASGQRLARPALLLLGVGQPEVVGRVGRGGEPEHRHGDDRGGDGYGVPAHRRGVTRSPGPPAACRAQASAEAMRLVEGQLGAASRGARASGRRSRRHRRRRPDAAAPRVTGTSCPKTRSNAATSSRTVTPVTAADVDDDAGRTDRGEHVVEPLDGPHVGPGEVPHVDVVADAGAVAGRVVGAGDREARPSGPRAAITSWPRTCDGSLA